MTKALLDTHYWVETPEGIELEAQFAGPVPRVLAYSIDLFIRGLVIIGFAILLAVLGKAGGGFILIIMFMLEWFYPVFFEVLKGGQTPGKQVLGLTVVNDDLTPISWNASMVRNLLRAADFLPLLYVGGLICMVINGQFRRLGDLAAGTLVVYKSQSEQSALNIPDNLSRVPSFALELEDQVAIIDFTQRHDQLSKARQQELANLLQPVIKVKDDEAIEYVLGVGGWLLGDKR